MGVARQNRQAKDKAVDDINRRAPSNAVNRFRGENAIRNSGRNRQTLGSEFKIAV